MRYASKLNSKVKPGVRHARGVSNAEQSRFGTVRKKVAADIRMNEQVKTSKNFKGVVKYDGQVPGLGHVLGLAIFLGRGKYLPTLLPLQVCSNIDDKTKQSVKI